MAISYRPVSNAAFVLHRHDSLILHLPGGAVQNQSVDRTLYLHLTLTDGVSPNRYGATIVLDSLRMTASALPVSPDSLHALRGLRWTATVDPSGRLADLRASRPTTLGDQLTGHLRLLFPILPPGGVQAGLTWADSIQFPLKADAFDATEQVRTTYRAAEDSLGIRIQSQSAYRRMGKGVQFDQQLEMTAAGARRETYLLGREGMLLAAEGSDSGAMTISVPAKGQTVPVDRASRYGIRAVGR